LVTIEVLKNRLCPLEITILSTEKVNILNTERDKLHKTLLSFVENLTHLVIKSDEK